MRIIFLVSLFLSLLNGDIYSKGSKNIGFTLGTSSSFNQTYTFLGINGEYCVVDNLAVGAAYRSWFGGDPSQNEISVYSNYFFPVDKKVRPYLGAFVRETFVSGGLIKDFFSYGARAGVSVITTKNSYFTIGYAIEYYENCVYAGQCHRTYPEVSIGLAF